MELVVGWTESVGDISLEVMCRIWRGEEGGEGEAGGT